MVCFFLHLSHASQSEISTSIAVALLFKITGSKGNLVSKVELWAQSWNDILSDIHSISLRHLTLNEEYFEIHFYELVCSVMNLLAEIYSQEEMIPRMFGALTLGETQEFDLNEAGRGDDAGGIFSRENPYMLSTLAPRLWPFMRHSITSVRYSAIRTLVNFSVLFYTWFFLETHDLFIGPIHSNLNIISH